MTDCHQPTCAFEALDLAGTCPFSLFVKVPIMKREEGERREKRVTCGWAVIFVMSDKTKVASQMTSEPSVCVFEVPLKSL